jgi:hypothetical protein
MFIVDEIGDTGGGVDGGEEVRSKNLTGVVDVVSSDGDMG